MTQADKQGLRLAVVRPRLRGQDRRQLVDRDRGHGHAGESLKHRMAQVLPRVRVGRGPPLMLVRREVGVDRPGVRPRAGPGRGRRRRVVPDHLGEDVLKSEDTEVAQPPGEPRRRWPPGPRPQQVHGLAGNLPCLRHGQPVHGTEVETDGPAQPLRLPSPTDRAWRDTQEQPGRTLVADVDGGDPGALLAPGALDERPSQVDGAGGRPRDPGGGAGHFGRDPWAALGGVGKITGPGSASRGNRPPWLSDCGRLRKLTADRYAFPVSDAAQNGEGR